MEVKRQKTEENVTIFKLRSPENGLRSKKESHSHVRIGRN